MQLSTFLDSLSDTQVYLILICFVLGGMMLLSAIFGERFDKPAERIRRVAKGARRVC